MGTQATSPVQLPFAEFLKNWWYMPLTVWRETFESFYHPQLFLGCNFEDMDDEYHVLNEVGSYGKQISQIQKLLDVLMAHVEKEPLSDEEQAALTAYRQYTARVAAALAEKRGPQPAELTTGYVERLEEALRVKRSMDKGEFDQVLEKLKAVVTRVADEQAQKALLAGKS